MFRQRADGQPRRALTLKPAEQEEILRRLFAPDGELRFTRGRLTMNANDYSRAWYACSEVAGDFDLAHFNIEHDKTNQIALVKMAQRLMGSPDMYGSRGSTASINFITAHDGFTLRVTGDTNP